MKRLMLRNLTFIGEGRKPSYIRFGPGATIIFDSSDTGSSIYDAIGFALGGRKPESVQKWEGYSHVLLALELSPDEYITLARSIDNGDSFVFDVDVLDTISKDFSPGFEQLVERYRAEEETDIPSFLLGRLGLNDKYVQKKLFNRFDPINLILNGRFADDHLCNKLEAINLIRKSKYSQNELHNGLGLSKLKFDDLARLCLKDVTDMQALVPAEFSQDGFNRRHGSDVRDSSVLRFVLTGDDDSTMLEILSSEQQELTHRFQQARRAQQEIIDDMIAEIEYRLDRVPDPEILKKRLAKVDEKIGAYQRNIFLLLNEHKELFAEYKKLQNQNDALSQEQTETITLRHRFKLLEDQYVSDLSRLAMVAEAHNMLTYLQGGNCHSCGSTLEGQRHNSECVESERVVRDAANAEAQKTKQLLAGLHSTTDDMENRLDTIQDSINTLERKTKSVRKKIRELYRKITPSETRLIGLFKQHQEIQDKLSLYERLDAYENIMRDITGEPQREDLSQPKRLNYLVGKDLSELIKQQLNLWGYHTNERIRYDRYKYDLFIGEKPLRAHSERERAVLHAAFAIALAQYCYRNQTPHLGFVVLDLPRIPEHEEEPRKNREARTLADCDIAIYNKFEHYGDCQIIFIKKEEPTILPGTWPTYAGTCINLDKKGFPHPDWPPNSPGWDNNNKVGE